MRLVYAGRLTFDPLIALKLLMRSWCRNTAVIMAVNDTSTNAIRIGRKCEVGNGNATIANPQLTIGKLMNDAKIMTFDPDPEGDIVGFGNITGN